MKNKKAFTLIELIAVLVILAILALIVTPLVLNIIRKARTSADKRSIDAYGRSIELAVASYLLDNGKFPTSVEQLTIEYSGDRVECETTKLNSDSSVYLASCTVDGRTVENYTYGEEASALTYTTYTVGNQVRYNNVDYYVIKDSNASESTVTLLKAEPLTYEEVQTYIVATQIDTHNQNGYGTSPYYEGSSCEPFGDSSGCVTDYTQSKIKYVVDAWAAAQATGVIEAGLMTYEEYVENSEVQQKCTGSCYDVIVPKHDWMYNSHYKYWLETPYNDSTSKIWCVDLDGSLIDMHVQGLGQYVIRPVITISKSAL